MMHFARFAIILICLAAGSPDVRAEARIEAGDLVSGDVLPLRVTGLGSGERVRMHAVRQLEIYRNQDGEWKRVPTQMHAWADFRADRRGTVQVGRDAPLAGTYRGIDDLGLLWSPFKRGDPALVGAWLGTPPTLEATGDVVMLLAERERGQALQSSFRLRSGRAGVRLITVRGPGFVGVFGTPGEARRLSTLIVLHGSEGGSIAKAQASAERYASQGFTTLSLIYFAWEYEKPEGVAFTRIENIPVEMLDRAREWLRSRPEADVDRIGLVGTSKGAEFALEGATLYPWVRAVVGCVPSDVVWQGFDQTSAEQPRASSWSIRSQPITFVPLFPFREGNPENYRTNTERYDRSRRAHPAEAERARIPIERSTARLLLIGSRRDEVWASGDMAEAIDRRLAAAGRGAQAEALVFLAAGHQICGDGTFPVRAYQQQSADPAMKVLEDEGSATVSAFRRSLDFLREALKPALIPGSAPT
jgi:hypothetical protein